MQNTLIPFDSPIFPEYHSGGVPLFKNCTELGRIYDVVPWQELENLLPVKETLQVLPHTFPDKDTLG